MRKRGRVFRATGGVRLALTGTRGREQTPVAFVHMAKIADDRSTRSSRVLSPRRGRVSRLLPMTEMGLMRWRGIEARLAEWFAESVEHMDFRVADKAMEVAALLEHPALAGTALEVLLEELDVAELARDGRSRASLREIGHALNDLARTLRRCLPGDVGEELGRYGRSSRSSRCTNVSRGMPNALQTSRSSRISSRRSLFSYLLTND